MSDINILFLGTPRFAQIVLENLINSQYKPSLVVTAPDAKSGRGQKVIESPVKQTALDIGIEVITPENLRTKSDLARPESDRRARDSAKSDLVDTKRGATLGSTQGRSSFEYDLAILVAYGKLIPKEILEIPKLGFINVHPSLLPKYRGPSPIQTAILDGEKTTGVTIMKLDEELDHGPILAQKEIGIEPNDTHLSLIEKLGLIGSNLLIETLPNYISGKIKPKTQNHKKATLTGKITKASGYIDLDNPPGQKTLDRMIRAYYPWPNVWTKVDGKIIKFLPQGLIQPEGKRPMTYAEFKNGYPQIAQKLQNLL